MSKGSYSVGGSDRYSAKNNLRNINFMFAAPEAKHVSVIGDFNNWSPNVHPMVRQADGGWNIQISLPHGHHHYVFLVDGTPTLDPMAYGMARNERNERVSLIAVS